MLRRHLVDTTRHVGPSSPGPRVAYFVSALALLTHCDRTQAPPAPTLRTASPLAIEATATPTRGTPAAPATTVARWCLREAPLVDVRALDRRGHSIAVQRAVLRDESAGVSTRLDDTFPPCAVQRDALSFELDGSAGALVRGRFFVRPAGGPRFLATPLCTDVDATPWSSRADGRGWAIAARRVSGRDLALLLTEDGEADQGWYARTALEPSITAALLDGDASLVVLTDGGHLVVIDRTQFVAGEVLNSMGHTFDTLTRTAAGLCAARDVSETERELLVGTSVTGRWSRRVARRPPGSRLVRAFVSDYGRVVVATTRGVEWADPRGDFVELLQWPSAPSMSRDTAHSAERFSNPTFGWLADGSPAIATRGALAAPCEALRRTEVR